MRKVMKTARSVAVIAISSVVILASAMAQTTPDIIGYGGGQITWTNVDPALYYTVEWRPSMTGTNTWTNSFRSLQDLQSVSPTMTANVPMFLRIVGRTNAIQTKTLSPTTNNIEAGYYEATTLSVVDPNLATGNIRSGVNIFGVPGKVEVVDTSSGSALASDIRAGKSAWAAGLQVDGIMPTRTLSSANDTLLAGYYAGTTLNAVDSDLIPANIRRGVTIFGMVGDNNVVNTSAGTAVAGDMLAGKVAYVAGAAVTGTVPAGTNLVGTNGALIITITNGLYSGAKTVTAGDSNLVSGNIRSGINIFGVAGSNAVMDTTTGNATAGDILTGKMAYVNGLAVTGNVPTGVNLTGVNGSLVITITNGLYSGAKTATAIDTNLVTGNIKSGVNIFGVSGSNTIVDTTSEPNLVTGNIRAGVTIFGVAGNSNVVNTSSGDAVTGDILSGKKAWVAGVERTGAMPNRGAVNITPGTTSQTVVLGYHNGSGSVAGDAALISANIRKGTTIFGVTGNTNVVDTSPGTAVAGDLLVGKIAYVDGLAVTGNVPAGANLTGTPGSLVVTIASGLYTGSKTATANDPNLAAFSIKTNVTIFGISGTYEGSIVYTYTNTTAAIPKTGQTTAYQTGDAGDLETGIVWPSPRFTIQADTNVVLDNLTGLMWARHADYWRVEWSNAVDTCNNVIFGGYSDWRLPNRRELFSLVDDSQGTSSTVALPVGHPFIGALADYYWTSSTVDVYPNNAWYVRMDVGLISYANKSTTYQVWPVRGGP